MHEALGQRAWLRAGNGPVYAGAEEVSSNSCTCPVLAGDLPISRQPQRSATPQGRSCQSDLGANYFRDVGEGDAAGAAADIDRVYVAFVAVVDDLARIRQPASRGRHGFR